jgi:hypothetical protein
MAPILPSNLVQNTQYVIVSTNNTDLQTPVIFLEHVGEKLRILRPSGSIKLISPEGYSFYRLGDPDTPSVTGIPITTTEYTQGAASALDTVGAGIAPITKNTGLGAGAARRRSRRNSKRSQRRRFSRHRRH